MNSHFNLLAPLYDRLVPFARLDRMLQLLNAPATGSLLDAGGGTGRVAAALRPYVGRLAVADVSPGMLRQARQKSLAAACAETEHLPFPDNAFDRVLIVDALHHVTSQAATVRELFRVLKPGGRLLIEEPDLRSFGVKLMAGAERLMLMRSHFLAPAAVAALLPPEAAVKIEAEQGTAWITAEKKPAGTSGSATRRLRSNELSG